MIYGVPGSRTGSGRSDRGCGALISSPSMWLERYHGLKITDLPEEEEDEDEEDKATEYRGGECPRQCNVVSFLV